MVAVLSGKNSSLQNCVLRGLIKGMGTVMLQKNTYSPFRKPELSSLHALPFIFIFLALILIISTTNVYSAQVAFFFNPELL